MRDLVEGLALCCALLWPATSAATANHTLHKSLEDVVGEADLIVVAEPRADEKTFVLVQVLFALPGTRRPPHELAIEPAYEAMLRRLASAPRRHPSGKEESPIVWRYDGSGGGDASDNDREARAPLATLKRAIIFLDVIETAPPTFRFVCNDAYETLAHAAAVDALIARRKLAASAPAR